MRTAWAIENAGVETKDAVESRLEEAGAFGAADDYFAAIDAGEIDIDAEAVSVDEFIRAARERFPR